MAAPDQASPRDILVLGMTADQAPRSALVFPGDLWAPDAVSLLADELLHHDVVYADEDRIDAGGLHCDPRLKPATPPTF